MEAEMKRFLLILPLMLLLGFAIYAAAFGWTIAGGAGMSGHGVTAMILGVVLSLMVAAVLVGLLLYSRRHGYDEPNEDS